MADASGLSHLADITFGNRGPQNDGSIQAQINPPLDPAVVAAGGLKRVVFVSPDGNNALGKRGTDFAFQTIAAALTSPNGAQDGDLVVLLPGTYNETVVIPAAFHNLSLIAWAPGNTKIVSSGSVAVSHTPTVSGTGRISFVDLDLQWTGAGGGGFFMDGGTLGAGATTPYYEFVRCTTTTTSLAGVAFHLNMIQTSSTEHCIFSGVSGSNTAAIQNTSNYTDANSTFSDNVYLQFDSTSPAPLPGRIQYALASTKIRSILILDGVPAVTGDKGCETDHIQTAGDLPNQGGTVASLRYNGRINKDVVIGVDTAAAATVGLDFKDAAMNRIEVNLSATGGPRCSVDLRNAIVNTEIKSNAEVDFDNRGGSYDTFSFVAAFTGTIDRYSDSVDGLIVPANAGAPPLTTTYTYGTAPVASIAPWPSGALPVPTISYTLPINLLTDLVYPTAQTNLTFSIKNDGLPGADMTVNVHLVRKDV
jgi:hypothetical protein